LTNDSSPLTFADTLIRLLLYYYHSKSLGLHWSQISRQLLKWCLTFKYIYEQLNWRHEAWSRSLKIMQSGYIKWFDGLLSCLLEHWSYYIISFQIFLGNHKFLMTTVICSNALRLSMLDSSFHTVSLRE